MTTAEAEPGPPGASASPPAKGGPTGEQPADTSTAQAPTAPQDIKAAAPEASDAGAPAADTANGAPAQLAAGCRPPAAGDGDRGPAAHAAAEGFAAGAQGDSGAHAAEAAPLSRNQQKKQAKQALVAERRAARKAEEKAARRAKQEEKHKDVRERLQQMSPEEREAWEKQRMEKRQVCAVLVCGVLPFYEHACMGIPACQHASSVRFYLLLSAAGKMHATDLV